MSFMIISHGKNKTVPASVSRWLCAFVLLCATASLTIADEALRPLPQAAREGSLSDLVRNQLAGEDIRQTDRGGNSLLHVAAAFGHLPAVGWLVDQGLEPAKRNDVGLTPADLAEANGHTLVVAFLRKQTPPRPTPARSANADSLPELTYRDWTSETGDSMEAAFINLHQNQVILKDRKDQRITIPMQRLSWRDQIMARRLSGQRGTEPLSTGRRATTQGRRESEARVIAAFGPDCESLLTDAIKDARREILIAIYTMTSLPITEALQEAAQRGVRIHVKYDEGQIEVGRMSEIIATLDAHRNITTTPIQMRGRFASMHHKFAILDQAVVFTGSFNFTVTAATQSYENAVVIYSDTIAHLYTQEFETIQSR